MIDVPRARVVMGEEDENDDDSEDDANEACAVCRYVTQIRMLLQRYFDARKPLLRPCHAHLLLLALCTDKCFRH